MRCIMQWSFTAAEKLKAIQRELEFRRYVFPRRVQAEKMTQRQADEQIAIFEEIALDYVKLAQSERLL